MASYEAGYGVGNAISGHDPEAISFSFYSLFILILMKEGHRFEKDNFSNGGIK